jgi:serine/threonine-protein kinase HipA
VKEARQVVAKAVGSWRIEAKRLGIRAVEIERMASAFEHEDAKAARASTGQARVRALQ